MARNWRSLALFALLAVTFATGSAIRARVAASDPLWIDELHTSWVVADGWSDVVDRGARGHQTPLYFWIVKFLADALGHTEWHLRLMSLVAGSALIVAAAATVGVWTRSWAAAWLTAALVALDGTSVFYASEARPYAFLQCIAVLQIAWLLTHLIPRNPSAKPTARAGWRLWFGVSISAVVMVSIHPASVLLLGAEAALMLILAEVHSGLIGKVWRRRAAALPDQPRPDRYARDLRLASALLVIAAALTLAAMPGCRETWQVRAIWSEVSDAGQLLTGHLLTMGVGAAAAVLLIGCRSRWFQAGGVERRSWAFAVYGLFLFAVAHLLAAMSDLSGLAPLAMQRYAIAALTVGWMGVAALMAVSRNKKTQWIVAAVVLGVTFVVQLPRREAGVWEWRSGSQWLLACLQPSELGRWRMRFEDWKSAIEQVDRALNQRPRPLLFLPGLLEEQLVAGQDALAEQSPNELSRFKEYLTFPLRGIYRLQNPAPVVLDPREFGQREWESWQTTLPIALVRSNEQVAGESWVIWFRDQANPNYQMVMRASVFEPPGGPLIKVVETEW